jgi:hypothetical protein
MYEQRRDVFLNYGVPEKSHNAQILSLTTPCSKSWDRSR